MEDKINVKDIEKTFNLVEDYKEIELRIIEPKKDSKNIKRFFVKSKEEFIEIAKNYSGKYVNDILYNIYFGVNERRTNKGKEKDVIKSKILPIDLDYKREGYTSTTDKQLKETIKLGLELQEEFFVKKGFLKPSMSMSGNGIGLYLKIRPQEFKDYDELLVFKEKWKAFTQEVRDFVEEKNKNIDVDTIEDLSRIFKVVGTKSIKGIKHRLTYWINYNNTEDKKLTDYIKTLGNLKIEEKDISLQNIFKEDKHIKNLFEGNIICEKYPKQFPVDKKINKTELLKFLSPSEAELSLVCRLIQRGLNKEQIFKIMASCKLGDWQKKTIQYRELTYKKGIELINKEKPNNQDSVKSFLKEERKKFKSLGCGYHNGVFYFGTKLFREGYNYNAVVTSDKKVYIDKRIKFKDNYVGENEIKTLFKLNYKEEFFDESLDNIFSNKAINKWIFEDCSDITIKGVFEELVSILKKYIYFEDKRKYSLLAYYRIAGFFMPVWRLRGRLFLFAEKGSSKSRLTQILHNTGFNSVSLGDWTLAYLKTIIESTRGETHIDDFETLSEELKNATIRLVKVGYMKGFKAGKMSEGKKRKPEVNDLFNTTTLNNTTGLDFVSLDRCLTIRIPKISKKEYDKEPNFEEKFWSEIRDKLYILGLKYAEEVKEVYENIKSENIRGRFFSIIKPELAIAKLISQENLKELEAFWIEETEQRQNINYESDWEFLALKQIYKTLSTLSTNSTLSTQSTLSTTEYFSLLEDIVKPIGLELYDNEEFKKKKRSMSIIIGNTLSRNPIFKKRLVKGKTQFKVDFEEFKDFLEAKDFLKPILDILEVDKVECVDSVYKEMALTSKEEVVANISNLEDLTFFIKANDNGSGVSKQQIANYSDNPEIEDLMNKAKVQGLVFENKAGYLKVLS
jgi:hypothetical protein